MALAWMPSCLCELRPEFRSKCPAQCSWRKNCTPNESAVPSVQGASRFFTHNPSAVQSKRSSPHFASATVQLNSEVHESSQRNDKKVRGADISGRLSTKDILFVGQAPPPPKPSKRELPWKSRGHSSNGISSNGNVPNNEVSDQQNGCTPSFRPFMGPSERRLAALADIEVAELWSRCDRHNLLTEFPGPQVPRDYISTKAHAPRIPCSAILGLHDVGVCNSGANTCVSGVGSIGRDVDGRARRSPRQAHKSGGDLFPAAEGRVAALELLAFAAASATNGVPRSSRFSGLTPTSEEHSHNRRSSSEDVTDPSNSIITLKRKLGVVDRVCGDVNSINESPGWKVSLFKGNDHKVDYDSKDDTEVQTRRGKESEVEAGEKVGDEIEYSSEYNARAREFVGDDGGCLLPGHLPDLGRYRTVVLLGLHVATAFGLKNPKLFDQRTIKINLGLHPDFLSAVARPGAGPALQAALADVDSDDNDNDGDGDIYGADSANSLGELRLQTSLHGDFSEEDCNFVRISSKVTGEGISSDQDSKDSANEALCYPSDFMPSLPSNQHFNSRASRRERAPDKRIGFGTSAMRHRWHPKHKARRYLRVRVCVLPHPSGVSHYWNVRAQRLRAARALRRLLHVPLPGEFGAQETRDSLRFLRPCLEEEYTSKPTSL